MSCVSAHFVHTLYKAEKSSTATHNSRQIFIAASRVRTETRRRQGHKHQASACSNHVHVQHNMLTHITATERITATRSLRPDLLDCTLQITTVLKHTHTTLRMRHAGPVPEYCKLAIRLPPTPSGTGHESIYRIPMVHSAHVLASALRPPLRNLIRPASCAGRCTAATR